MTAPNPIEEARELLRGIDDDSRCRHCGELIGAGCQSFECDSDAVNLRTIQVLRTVVGGREQKIDALKRRIECLEEVLTKRVSFGDFKRDPAKWQELVRMGFHVIIEEDGKIVAALGRLGATFTKEERDQIAADMKALKESDFFLDSSSEWGTLWA